MKGPLQTRTAPTRAAKKPAEPKLTALLRAPLAPPVAVGEEPEEGVVTVEGDFVVEEVEVRVAVVGKEVLLPGIVEREEPAGELPVLEEPAGELPVLEEVKQVASANGRWV